MSKTPEPDGPKQRDPDEVTLEGMIHAAIASGKYVLARDGKIAPAMYLEPKYDLEYRSKPDEDDIPVVPPV